MNEAQEMYEGIESVVEDLIQEYENQLDACTFGEGYSYNQGAIDALNRLIQILNE